MSTEEMSQVPSNAPGGPIIGHGLEVLDLAADVGQLGACKKVH